MNKEARDVYQKWYDHALKVFASNEEQIYEHPSEEIRLKMQRLDREEDKEVEIPSSWAVQLQLIWKDPLLETHISMWTKNPYAMAMLLQESNS